MLAGTDAEARLGLCRDLLTTVPPRQRLGIEAPGGQSRGEIVDLLTSGAIKGVGPKLAEALVATFGERTLEVLQSSGNDDELLQLPGVGAKTLGRIADFSLAADRGCGGFSFAHQKDAFVRLHAEAMSDYVSNWAEVSRTLAGTRFEYLLTLDGSTKG